VSAVKDDTARAFDAEADASDNEVGPPTPVLDELPSAPPGDRDADEFLRLFHRPARPPSPEPEQRAESAGGAFVAHYTVARPVPATKRAASQPGVQVERDTTDTSLTSDTSDLAALIRVDSSPDTVGPRDLSTAVRTSIARRRVMRALVAASLVVMALFLIVAALLGRSSPGPTPSSASSASSSPSSPSAPGLVGDPGTAASVIATPVVAPRALRAEVPIPVVSGASSAAVAAPRASARTPRLVPTPAREPAPRPAPPKDPTTDMLPDEP
jgi:hypothetical protein